MKTKYTLLLLLFSAAMRAQQVPDTAFLAPIAHPTYESGRGSIVLVDAGHHNFHTIDGRYAPFARFLGRDGYRLESSETAIRPEALQHCKIFVISNPIAPSQSWNLPTASAFSGAEITVLNEWVKRGGRLLLIADHMPFAGSAENLAKSFGFEFANCFAMDNRRRSIERFYKENKTLLDNELTAGIDTVVSFTGSAFRIPEGATGVLALNNYTLLFPDAAWDFTESTTVTDSKGYFQGAYMQYGKGKIVVMGEAAMFSAQLAGPEKARVGMNHPAARQNAQFLLNIIHWLDQDR